MDIATRLYTSFTKQPVKGAKVEILSAIDSSLVTEAEVTYYDYTGQNARDERGMIISGATWVSFSLTETGKYIAKCSAEGFEDTYNSFEIKRYSEEIRSIPNLYIRKARPRPENGETLLDAAVVKATKVKFYLNGDTMVYNADAFELAEGSMLDALIRQLPGVELKQGGEIFVNGRKVEELLLNGKDFFNSDRQLILDNLPAYMVKNVKVYEHEDEMERRFYGEGGGREQKRLAMDIRLKRQYAIGWIANAEAGIGTDNRFLGRLFALRFTPQSRVSIFGNANNLSDNRQPGYNGDWTPLMQAQGVMDSYTGGIDYNVVEKDNDYRLNGNLRVSYTEQDNFSHDNRENFLEGGNTFGRSFSKSTPDNLQVYTGHDFNFIAGPFSISFKPKFIYGNVHNNSSSAQATLSGNVFDWLGKDWMDSIANPRAGGLLRQYALNRTVILGKGDGRTLSGGGDLSLETRLPRRFFIETFGGYNIDDYRQNSYDHYTIQYPSAADSYDDFRNRYQFRKNRNTQYYIGIDPHYQLVPTRATFVGVRYSYTEKHQEAQSSLYLLNRLEEWGMGTNHALGNLPSVDELLTAFDADNSTRSKRTDYTHIADFYYIIKENHWEGYLRLPVRFERNKFDYQQSTIDTLLYRNQIFFEPNLYVTYNCWPKISVSFRYNLSSSVHPMSYLAGYHSSSDPLNIMEGAKELKNRHSHQFGISLHRNMNGPRMHYINLGGNIHQNSLALGYTYDRTTGVRTITPQTVNGNWDARIDGGFSSPLDSLRRWNLQTNASLAYYNSVDMIDQRRSEVGSYYADATLKIDYRPTSRLYLAAKADVHYQHSMSEREDFETIDVADFDYGLTAQIELPLDFQIATDLTMYSRRGYADAGMNTNELVWNARLSKRFLGGSLVLMADAFDLLGNLSNVRRSINAQGRVETWNNVTPRYALFHIVYRFNKQPRE